MKEKTKGKDTTICLFGTYDSTNVRIKTLVNAAQEKEYSLLTCHIPFWELSREKHSFLSLKSMLLNLVKLSLIHFRLMIKYLGTPKHDAVIVGYNGYFDLPLAKLLTKIRRIPLLFTPLFPLYETLIEDRSYMKTKSFKSKMIHKIDEIGCRLADLIVIETDEYIKYYNEEFRIPKEKFFKIPLGADEKTFYPRPSDKAPSKQIKVLFYGTFIPLQGIRYIIEAAKCLENDPEIKFEIIGSGQLSEDIQKLAAKLQIRNVTFIEWVEYDRLPLHIQDADICLGIFGDTPKARRGIPIKVYEEMAMKKPVITGDTPAARDVFSPGENVLLCPMADAEGLSEKILQLKSNENLRKKIAQGGYELYHRIFSEKCISDRLETALNKCITGDSDNA
jgi:glycosyltransferase involved in cell wall biosynthesis